MLNILSKIANSHYTGIFLALILFGTAGNEIINQLEHDSHQIGAHHGVALYGLVMLIKEILAVVQSTDEMITHIKERNNSDS